MIIKTYNRKLHPGDAWITFPIGYGNKELLQSVSIEFQGTIEREIHAEAYIAKDMSTFTREMFITRKRWILKPDDPTTWKCQLEYNQTLEIPYNYYMHFSPAIDWSFNGSVKFQVDIR